MSRESENALVQVSLTREAPVPSLVMLRQYLDNPTGFYQSLPYPVYWDKTIKSWVVTGFLPAKRVLGNPAVFSVARLRSNASLQAQRREDLVPLNSLLQRQILFTDGIAHDAIRDLLLPSFHRKGIATLDAYIRATVENLLAPYHQALSMDLADVISTLPTRVSAYLLGLEEGTSSVEQWKRWNTAFEDVLGSLQSLLPSHAAQTLPALAEASAYFRELVHCGRGGETQENPVEGSLLRAMLSSPMECEDIVANCMVLLAGGYQTTTQLITRCLWRAYRTPHMRDVLTRYPERLTDALKETMRLDGSSQFLGRRVTQDTILAGETMKAGENVVVLLAAANRDPQQFPQPDTFDLDRSNKEHLGFGLGAHHCWGADLAMLEAKIAVQEFLARFTDAQFPPEETITWGSDPNIRYPLLVPLLLRRVTSSEVRMGENGGWEVEVSSADHASPEWGEEELLRAVRVWNATKVEVPRHLRAHHFFELQAQMHPGAPAIVEQGSVLFTYRQFNERANQLAHLLQQRGVGPQTLIGVFMNRSSEAALLLLAILKAGGVYAPLASDENPERLKTMVGNMHPFLVLSKRALREQWAVLGNDLPVLELDGLEALLDQYPNTNPSRWVDEQHLAYIIYTSGSTGEPKGVEIPHKSVTQLVIAQALLAVSSSDRILQAASLAYDASIFELLLALCHGAALCIPSFRSGRGLADFLRAERVTAMVLTPSSLKRTPADDLPDLRLVMAAGETCTADVVARWEKPGRLFYNLYGPTEACIWATAERCEANGSPPGIGRPVANKEVYILDKHLRLVPPGVQGMLYIGGGLFRGYRGDPALTSRVLIPHPFSTQPGAQLYCSGDLASLTPAGNILFHDRVGDYVKVNGLRIGLGEIEDKFADAPGIAAGAVVLREYRLVAFVVPLRTYNEEALLAHLKRMLRPAMVPSRIVTIADLPGKQHSDKLDRGYLQRMELPPLLRGIESACLAATGDADVLELQVLELFCKVLEREDVQLDSNFFDYDGDSAMGLDLLLYVEEHFGLRLDDMIIYEYQTPRAFASHLRAMLSPSDAQDALALPAAPLSPGQWIVCRQPLPGAGVRLFVLPEAGVGASHYYSWQHIFQEYWGNVELCFIQLPGREERRRETPFTDLSLLVEALAQQMKACDDKPYALYGHSLGGLIGFELVRALRREQLPLPLYLWLSGCTAPHLPNPARAFYRESDDVFLAYIRKLGEVPEELSHDSALLQRMLPLLRADFSLVATHSFIPSDPLPINVSVWGGKQDTAFCVDNFLAWTQIQPDCSIHLVEGGHFFHHGPAARHMLVSTICSTLQRLLREGAYTFE